MHRSILFRGAADFPLSLGSHPPPHLDFGLEHQQTFNSVQDCLSSQEAG